MSRIGRAPITVPAGVEIKVEDNNVVTVKGPKGSLTQQFNTNMAIAVEDGVLHVTRPNDAKENRALHGLTRTLIHNMVVGVTEGFKKELDVNGVGYRVAKEGKMCIRDSPGAARRRGDRDQAVIIHLFPPYGVAPPCRTHGTVCGGAPGLAKKSE